MRQDEIPVSLPVSLLFLSLYEDLALNSVSASRLRMQGQFAFIARMVDIVDSLSVKYSPDRYKNDYTTNRFSLRPFIDLDELSDCVRGCTVMRQLRRRSSSTSGTSAGSSVQLRSYSTSISTCV